MSRRDQGLSTEQAGNFGLLQTRRRYSDSKRFWPLKIQVPPRSNLFELEGRFENPRKAPKPQGLKYNTILTPNSPAPNLSNLDSPPFGAPLLSTFSLIPVEPRQGEFSNLSEASIFALPKFDPEKEMRILQNLWSKRCSPSNQPLICRSLYPAASQISDDSPRARSFFESDSESDEEEAPTKR